MSWYDHNIFVFQGIATKVAVRGDCLWPVPEGWSLEQAATVPVVYFTAYYALVIRARMSPGDSVLIHSGSGGVGQAAITLAIHHGCKVFTTVGSKLKRDYLKERFPELDEKNIFSSRDTAFEIGILAATAGKGTWSLLCLVFEEVDRAYWFGALLSVIPPVHYPIRQIVYYSRSVPSRTLMYLSVDPLALWKLAVIYCTSPSPFILQTYTSFYKIR